MQLLIDLGNSRVKWACWHGADQFSCHASLVLGPRVEEELSREWKNLPPPEQIWIASVGQEAHSLRIVDSIDKLWGCGVERLATQKSLAGVTNGYRLPNSLGVDRWLALVGAHAHYRGPLVVCDAGSALTLDAIDRAGNHLGGLIVPGVAAQYAALPEGLPWGGLDGLQPSADVLLGRTTEECIDRGIVTMYAALIERFCAGIAALAGDGVRCVLTGGDGKLLSGGLAQPCSVDSMLVFRGMAVAAAENGQ